MNVYVTYFFLHLFLLFLLGFLLFFSFLLLGVGFESPLSLPDSAVHQLTFVISELCSKISLIKVLALNNPLHSNLCSLSTPVSEFERHLPSFLKPGQIFHYVHPYSIRHNYSQIQLWYYTCWTFDFWGHSPAEKYCCTKHHDFFHKLKAKRETAIWQWSDSKHNNVISLLNFGLSRVFKKLYCSAHLWFFGFLEHKVNSCFRLTSVPFEVNSCMIYLGSTITRIVASLIITRFTWRKQ